MEDESIQNVEQQSADSSASSEHDAEVVQISRADLEGAIAQAASDSANAAASQIVLGLSESIEGAAGGEVTIVGTQWDTLTQLSATQLHVGIAGCAFLALILGAVVGVALTLHWRGARG